jgi:hypothetical protein
MNKVNTIALFLRELKNTQTNSLIDLTVDNISALDGAAQAFVVVVTGNNRYSIVISDEAVNDAESSMSNVNINVVDYMLSKLPLSKYKYMHRDTELLYKLTRRMN